MSYSRRPTTDREDIDDCLKREFGDLFRDHPEFATRFRLRPTRGFSSQTEEDDFYRDLPGFPDDRFFRSSRPSRFGDGDFGFRHRPSFDNFYNDQYFPSDHRQRSSGAQEGSTNSERRAEQKAPDNLNKPPQAPKTEERSRKPTSNIQQSNTVDLGQKQEPVDDQRNQRSMSAPPDNRSPSGKRYVSSIKIPNLNSGQTGPSGDMGSRQSQPEASSHPQQPQPQQQHQSQQTQKPTERIIPIHIEGRDEPIVPKNANVPFSSTPPPQQPQPERIFGQRPSTFTQFLNRGEQQEELLKRQQEEMMREQYQKQQQEYQKQQHENFQRQQQEQKQQPQEQQIPKQVEKPTPLDLIQNIQKDVSNLMGKVETFAGKPKDKEYLYLDEMLTRNLLRLDDIETEGKDVIRQARKEAINCIQQTIQILESKAKANEQQLKAKSEDGNVPSDAEPVDPKLKEEKSQEVPEKVETAPTTETPQKMDTEENTTKAAETSDPPVESNKIETEDKVKSEAKEDVAVKEAEQPAESEAPSQEKTEDSSTEKAKVKKKK